MRLGWLIGATLMGAVVGGILVKKLWLKKYHEQARSLAVAEQERDLLYTWILLKGKGVNLTEYFAAHGLKTVGILGMNRIGRRFCDELKGHDDVSVVYGVESEHLGAVHETLTVYRLGDDPLPPADCMVICDLERVPDKKKAVRQEFSGKIILLSKMMEWLLDQHHIEPRDGAIDGWPFENKQ